MTQAAATLHGAIRQVRRGDDSCSTAIATALPLNLATFCRRLFNYDEARITLSSAFNELAHMSHYITFNMRVQATSV
jgi:hypothetical protein